MSGSWRRRIERIDYRNAHAIFTRAQLHAKGYKTNSAAPSQSKCTQNSNLYTPKSFKQKELSYIVSHSSALQWLRMTEEERNTHTAYSKIVITVERIWKKRYKREQKCNSGVNIICLLSAGWAVCMSVMNQCSCSRGIQLSLANIHMHI